MSASLPCFAGLLVSLFVPALAAQPLYIDVTATALPLKDAQLRSMDAEMGDVNGDGHLDIFVAREFSKNLLLINQGDGTFKDASDHLPSPVHDSEDIALADFDGDGDLDAVIVAEDDRIDLYYQNDGTGRFTMAKLPASEITNGVTRGDVDGDGDEDLVTGNAGRNHWWRNDGGVFTAVSGAIPEKQAVSQDVQLGDLDGDGDLDLVEANEGRNRVLLNDGRGQFVVLETALPDVPMRESRQAALGDVDADGDLDLVIGNVFLGFSRRLSDEGIVAGYGNRLFLNRGDATFSVSPGFPQDELQSPHIGLVDLDHDGDLDILATSIENFGQPSNGRVHAYLNDGTGTFTDETTAIFPETFVGNGWDVAIGDVNGDGKPDLFLANRFGEDRLLLAK